MATPAKTRLAGLLVATLALPFCAAGTSRAGEVVNGQLQLGDVLGHQTLDVQESAEGVAGSALSVGNTLSATGQAQAVHVESDQAVQGHVESSVVGTVGADAGPYYAVTSEATGNTATAGTCCAPTTGSSLQALQAGSAVSADAQSQLRGRTGGISIDVSAVGSTTGWEQVGGGVQTWTGQTADGLTIATNSGSAELSTGNAGLSATAVSNNVTGDLENAGADLGVGQQGAGGTTAVIDFAIASGTDIQAMATGVGNNVDVQATGSTVAFNAQQQAAGATTVYSNLEAANWSGDATVSAYGVGNSVVVSNNGPRVQLWNDQTVSGPVDVGASFTGGTGAHAYASSTAMGNAVSGYACDTCGGELSATNRQTGNARVRANSALAVTGRARSVAADATAIGNSATYQVVGSGQ